MKRTITCFGLAMVAAISSAQLKATLYASGFSLPVAMIQDPTNPSRQFVLQQRGLIRVVVNGVVQGTNAIDLTATVSSSGSEKGLLGLAFAPDYATSGKIYIYYTSGTSTTTSHIARITRNPINPAVFDGPADVIFQLAQPFANHNGGTLRFGPDGYLYLGLGDGGSAGDPGDRAQNLTNLLGKMLRIDPSVDDFPADPLKDYRIPPGQPFSGTWGTLAPEIWALGLRNPWKFSFDPASWLGTDGMFIADVGQNAWEEISYQPPGASARNYGWRAREGYANYTTTSGPHTIYKDPIWVYSHSVGQSITGGYVYRGLKLGDYFGRYFFADYVASKVFSFPMVYDSQGEGVNISAVNVTEHTSDLPVSASGISSIDIDAAGELYYINYGGGQIYRIDPEDRAWMTDMSLGQAILSSGQIRSLSLDDGKLLVYSPDYSEDTLEGDAGVLKCGFTHNKATVSTLRVILRAKTNQAAGHNARILVKNWSTGRFEQVLSVNLTPTLTTFDTGTFSSTNRIRGDGRIEVILQGTSQLGLTDPIVTSVDQMKLTVN